MSDPSEAVDGSRGPVATDAGHLLAEARRIGRDVAGPAAGEVDREARFPAETFAALRAAGLTGALVPDRWGGPGLALTELSPMVAAVAADCGSSGLILAMHHIQVATVVRHGPPELQDELLPRVADGGVLLANANSEVGLAGERRASTCALEPTEGGFHLEKEASTVSYGEAADAILATARRSPESRPNDQVLVVALPGEFALHPTGEWDTLGLRGTSSRPGTLVADVPAHHVLGDYGTVFVRTALPVSTVMLNSVWMGLAEAAADQAHRAVRTKARKHPPAEGAAPPLAATRLAELAVPLHQIRDAVAGAALRYEQAKDTEELETLRFTGRMDSVKLTASTRLIDVALGALAICGLPGYQNQSPVSLTRVVRDALAAPLMVNNDRSLQATAQTLLVRKEL